MKSSYKNFVLSRPSVLLSELDDIVLEAREAGGWGVITC